MEHLQTAELTDQCKDLVVEISRIEGKIINLKEQLKFEKAYSKAKQLELYRLLGDPEEFDVED
jgi:hypothetical protein